MKVEVRHGPSFAIARVNLRPGEQFRAESGAMMATSSGVTIESSTRGGMLKSGEGFVFDFTGPGWVMT